MDFIAAEKRDLKELLGMTGLLFIASACGAMTAHPASALVGVLNLVGLLLFVPIFIGGIRITKRGTPAIKVLGVFSLILTGALFSQTIKWFFQLR